MTQKRAFQLCHLRFMISVMLSSRIIGAVFGTSSRTQNCIFAFAFYSIGEVWFLKYTYPFTGSIWAHRIFLLLMSSSTAWQYWVQSKPYGYDVTIILYLCAGDRSLFIFVLSWFFLFVHPNRRYLGIQQIVFGGRRMGDWEEGMTSPEFGYKYFKI